MKKNFLGLVAIPMLALLATSCAQETVETKGGDNVLTYGVATGKQTLSRAAEVLDLEGTALTVKAYNGDAEHATFTLEHDGSAWGYGDVVYHPTFPLEHFSVVPWAADFAYDGTDATFTYDSTDDEDLLVAQAGTTALSTNAHLVYSHALSQINFAINGVQNIKVTVQNIAINGVMSTGTYTIGGDWSDQGGSTTFNYTAAAATTTGVLDAPAVNLTGTDNRLMMIPHEFTGATLTFEYQITDMANNPLIPAAELNGEGWKEGSVVLSGTWVSGSKYLYTLNFTSPSDPISYTVEVDLWAEPTDIPVSVQ